MNRERINALRGVLAEFDRVGTRTMASHANLYYDLLVQCDEPNLTIENVPLTLVNTIQEMGELCEYFNLTPWKGEEEKQLDMRCYLEAADVLLNIVRLRAYYQHAIRETAPLEIPEPDAESLNMVLENHDSVPCVSQMIMSVSTYLSKLYVDGIGIVGEEAPSSTEMCAQINRVIHDVVFAVRNIIGVSHDNMLNCLRIKAIMVAFRMEDGEYLEMMDEFKYSIDVERMMLENAYRSSTELFDMLCSAYVDFMMHHGFNVVDGWEELPWMSTMELLAEEARVEQEKKTEKIPDDEAE